MKLRGKHAAVAVALVGGGVLATSAFLFRNDILEMWHASRLESKDPAERTAALEALRPMASGPSIPALLRIVEEDSGLQQAALAVLLDASPRMHSARRREAALSLREMVRGEVTEFLLAFTYGALAAECPDLFPLLAEDLRGEDRGLRKLAARALIQAWPRSRQAIFVFARDAETQNLLAFLGYGFGFFEVDSSLRALQLAAARKLQGRAVAPGPGEGVPEDIRGAPEVTRTLLLDHERPEARAAALSFAVCRSFDGSQAPDVSLLKEVYTRDSSFLVRRAALRLAAYAGEVPGSLDLAGLSWSEPDPALRVAALLARDVWSFSARNPWLEIWDGAVTTWAPRPHPGVSTPWSLEEARALEQLLLESEDPALRDAASMALAGRHRHFIDARRGPPVRPDLEVREWSLIRRAEEIAGDASDRELPEFVRGVRTSAWQQADDALFASHGAVFFDAASPASLLVLLEPCQILPLDVHPPSTNYFAAHPGLHDNRIDPDSPGTSPLVHPVRIWNQQPLVQDPLRQGPDWCGVRIGYGERLEPRPAAVSPGSRWDLLRRNAAKDVSLRGVTERFLFYGGRLGVSSPVRTFREDSGRVLVAVRPLDGIPCKPGQEPSAPAPISALFIIKKPPGQPPRGRLLEGLDGDTPPRSVDLGDLDLAEEALVGALRAALVRAGLASEEAALLIESSRREMLETEGVRVAWLLPRWLHDALIRLTVLPLPGKLVRVGLVVEEVSAASPESPSAEDRPLLWEFEPGTREEVEAEFTESPLPSLPSEPLVLEDGQLEGLAVDVSADGSRALIQRDSQYFIADLEAGLLIRLSPVKGPGKPWWPSLSADGKHISFSSWSGEAYRVQVADLERGTLHTLALDLPSFPETSLSGDGTRVGVCGSADGIHVFDLGTQKAWFVRTGICRDSLLELSGDGRRAVSIRPEGKDDEDILLVDLETGATLDVSRSSGRELLPTISRDGNRIAFVRALPGLQGVWLADVEARSRTRISLPDSSGQLPSLSADGSHIAFTAGGKVRVRDLRTGGLREAGSSEGGVGVHVSNDGRRTVFTRRDADGFHVRFEGAEE